MRTRGWQQPLLLLCVPCTRSRSATDQLRTHLHACRWRRALRYKSRVFKGHFLSSEVFVVSDMDVSAVPPASPGASTKAPTTAPPTGCTPSRTCPPAHAQWARSALPNNTVSTMFIPVSTYNTVRAACGWRVAACGWGPSILAGL